MLLNHTTSSLIIIDVQDKFMPTIHQADEMVENCKRLIQVAGLLDIPLLLTEQYPSGLGNTIAALVEMTKGAATSFDKTVFSALKDPAFKTHIMKHAVPQSSQLILAGIEAHVCVLQTALDLKALGYEVFVVADAVSSRDPGSLEFALSRLRAGGVHIVTTEMVMFEWVERFDSPVFKEMQSLIM